MCPNQPGQFVRLSDGARLRVKMLGGGDRTKPLVVALHGAQGVSDHREPLRSFGFLAPRFRVLVYDARGSGDSDAKGPFTHERWAADVDELRQWAEAEEIILAGGSYGGMVALEYAIAYPRRTSALVLRDTWANGVVGCISCLEAVLTSPRIAPDPDRQLRAWSGGLRDNDDLAAAFAEILPIYTPEDAPEGAGQDAAAAPEELKLHYETHNFCFAHNQPRFDVRQQARGVEAPTLVVCGRHDPMTPVVFSEEIAELMPNAQLTVFEKSGHSPPADEPEAFRERVWRFLDGAKI